MATNSTQKAILDAAEQLFAERGFHAVSVREITRIAAVNVAAVNYHFGNKEAVLRGVADRVVSTINERRIQLLDELLADDPRPDTAALLRAFIRPDLEVLQELHDRGPTVARFLGKVYLDQTPWIQDMALEQFAPSAAAYFPPLQAALPHLTSEDVAGRLRRVGVVLAHAFATWPVAGLSNDEVELMTDELVSFCARAVAAPVSVPQKG